MHQDTNLRDGFWIEDGLVEPQLGRVRRNGLRRQIEPKIMAALMLLAEEYPRVVHKDRFLQEVWGDVNVVNHVVARAISELRGVFGDEARNPRIIETIPKAGYRLIAPPVLRSTQSEPVHAAMTDRENGRHSPNPHRVGRSRLAVGALVAVAVLCLWGIVAGALHRGFPGH